MSDHSREFRQKLEQFGDAPRAEMEQLAREFQRSVKALLAALVQRPEELHRRMDELARQFERNLAAVAEKARIGIETRFGTSPGKPQRRPYVERTLPRPRGRKRPSAGGVPVTPDRPKGLSGGAAAPLEFDRD